MSATTINRRYEYPIATDRPGDTALFTSRAVAAMDADLLYLDSEYKRFERYPFALIERNVPYSLDIHTGSTPVTFDTVIEDTWGMVDLAKAPTVISIPPDVPGYYAVGGWIACGGINTVDLRVYMTAGGWGGQDSNQPDGNDTDQGINGWGVVMSGTDASTVNLTVTTNLVGTFLSISSARLWLYWVRDL